jgi:nicotinamidase-related amidase
MANYDKSLITKSKWAIDPDDAVMLLVDHQSGLFQTVRDMEEQELRRRATCLAKAAKLAGVPTFTTASVPDGPNGPLIPDIHKANSDAVYIPRTGQINAWDNPAWIDAIKKTGRKTLIIAGTLTSVCMAFPALSAVEAGYRVFCVVDASGNWDKMATDITIARVTQAGCMPIDTFAVLAELMSTWNRTDAMEYAAVMAELIPPFQALNECYAKAQSVKEKGAETIMDKVKN